MLYKEQGEKTVYTPASRDSQQCHIRTGAKKEANAVANNIREHLFPFDIGGDHGRNLPHNLEVMRYKKLSVCLRKCTAKDGLYNMMRTSV